MDNRISFIRGFLLPIGIGILSMAGIGFILWIVYFDTPTTDIPAEPSYTPFKYLLLATETGVPSLEAQTPGRSVAPTKTPIVLFSDPTPAFGNPTETITTPQATRTPTRTANKTSIFPAGKYDDMDERITYDGDWTRELLITDAYQGTISYSTTIGSSASFTFTGTQLQIGYLGEIDLGILLVFINGDEYALDQSSDIEWSSPELPFSTYSVELLHQDGEQVFFDYINIIGTP
jgi:hypothetical protein